MLLMVAGIVTGAVAGHLTGKRQYEALKQGRHVPYGPYEAVIKRPLDLLAGILAAVVLFPVWGITALLVWKKLGSPVLFTQWRTGLYGRQFRIYKFRTMTDETDRTGRLLPDEERLTRFGQVLRSMSLDELPEFINIIKGDMSLAGPRPLLVEYMGVYDRQQKHRHDITPGLTGLAQVNGRNSLSWEEKFAYDLEYIRKVTFLGDIKILAATVKAVFERTGISPDTSPTMEVFTGSSTAESQTKNQKENHDA